MLSESDIIAIAREMAEAREQGRQIAPFSSRIAGFGLADGYAVAAVMHRDRVRRGAVPVGRKIGFTNSALWPIYGVREPIWAHIYDTTVVHVRGGRASCALGGFAEPKIEPEIVLHFHAAPPVGGDAAGILASIDWIAHGFEIVQSHFPGWKFQAADTVADHGLHGTLLVGEPQPADRLGPELAERLERFSLSLFKDGALCETGRGANVLGNPLRAIAHLVAVLQQQPECQPLQAGEWVTTGTVTNAYDVRAGDCWRSEIRGLDVPGLAVEFD